MALNLETIIQLTQKAISNGATSWDDVNKLCGLNINLNQVFALFNPGLLSSFLERYHKFPFEEENQIYVMQQVYFHTGDSMVCIDWNRIPRYKVELYNVEEFFRLIRWKEALVYLDSPACEKALSVQLRDRCSHFLGEVGTKPKSFYEVVKVFFNGIDMEGNNTNGRGHVAPCNCQLAYQGNNIRDLRGNDFCQVICHGDITGHFLNWEGVHSTVCLTHFSNTDSLRCTKRYFVTSLDLEAQRILDYLSFLKKHCRLAKGKLIASFDWESDWRKEMAQRCFDVVKDYAAS